MNLSSHEDDIFVVRLTRRRLKEEATRRYRVHSYFNKSGELGRWIATRALDQMDIILEYYTGSYKYLPFLNNQDLSSRIKWNVPQQATQV
jgi:hypothetical protein